MKEEYFTQILGLKYGTSLHNCISRVFAIINSKEFIKLFIDWRQEKIVNKIIENKGLYYTMYEKEHGRIEKRKYYLSYETECISNNEKCKK